MKKRNDNDFQVTNFTSEGENAAASSEGSGIRQDALRSRVADSAQAELPFKKSLYGYDASDVKTYIKDLNANSASVVRVYEKKIAELKEELTLCYRERDSLKTNNAELKTELDAKNAMSPEDNIVQNEVVRELEKRLKEEIDRNAGRTNEYENLIADLNKKYVKSENEVQRLSAFEKQVNDYANANTELNQEMAVLKQNVSDLKLELARFAEVGATYDKIAAENEQLKADAANIKSHYEEAANELNAKSESFTKINAENERLKMQLSEAEIKYSVLSQQNEKTMAEMTEIKDKNKTQAYDFAAKVNDIESKYTKEKLNLQKTMQVNEYHIKQMNMLVRELSAQVEQVNKSFEETQILK